MPPSLKVERVFVGQEFASGDDLRNRVRQSFLTDSRYCRSVNGGGRQRMFVCTGRKFQGKSNVGCRAVVRAYRSRKTNLWGITVADLRHVNCAGEQKRVSPAALLSTVSVLVGANPDMGATAIQKTVKSQTGVELHRRAALRCKELVLKETSRGMAEGFHVLGSFLTKLRSESNGTGACVRWDREGRFRQCFVMLGGAANVAAKSPQQCFSLDATPLKGAWNGVLLTLTTLDANKRLNLCAFSVGPEENAGAYEFLLKQAMRNKQIRNFVNNPKTTCFTDGEKGADDAMAGLAPLTEIRHCLEHILRKIGATDEISRRHAYQAARHPTREGFEHAMGLLHSVAPVAHDKLSDLPHDTWAQYAGRQNACWDQVTTNPAEAMNAMIRKLRSLPVFDLVHALVLHTANRLHEATQLREGDPHARFTPYAMDYYNEEFRWSQGLTARPLGHGAFYVTDGSAHRQTRGHRALVAWDKRLSTSSPRDSSSSSSSSSLPPRPVAECSCAVPQKMQLPCRHVLAAARAQGRIGDTLSLIHEGFLMEAYCDRAGDPAFPLVLPVWDSFETDTSKKPPALVPSADGRLPAATRRKNAKRIPSTGECAARKRVKSRR